MANKKLFSEILQNDLTSKNIINDIDNTLNDDNYNNIIFELDNIITSLYKGNSHQITAQYIINYEK